jgi:hypothetical protein
MARITRKDSTKAGKRVGLACIAIFLLAGFCFGQAASSSSPSGSRPTTEVRTNWSQFHFTAGGTRLNPYEKVLNVKNVGRLVRKWSYAAHSDVVSSPAVTNGVVYFGSADGNVHALNARWRQAVELLHRRSSEFLARGGEWSGLYRLGRQRVRAEGQHRCQTVEVRDGWHCRLLAQRRLDFCTSLWLIGTGGANFGWPCSEKQDAESSDQQYQIRFLQMRHSQDLTLANKGRTRPTAFLIRQLCALPRSLD